MRRADSNRSTIGWSRNRSLFGKDPKSFPVVARLLEGEEMATLCAEFEISRKTGYKNHDQHKDCGVAAFSDRSRRPHRKANRLPAPIEGTIALLKREYPG